MRAKDTKNLQLLATASGKTANEISTIIVSELEKRRFILNRRIYCGCTIGESLAPGVRTVEMVQVMTVAGIPNKSRFLDAIRNLVLMGNGDCPECGGEMEVVDGDYKELRGDYLSPSEFTPIWESKKCSHCGQTD